MNIDEDRKKADLKTDSFVFCKRFHFDKAIKFTQNCICFTIWCINLLDLLSVIREYQPKVLELLHLLQCIATDLVVRRWKPIKCMLKPLCRGCRQYLIVRKKQTVQLPAVTPSSALLWLSIQF